MSRVLSRVARQVPRPFRRQQPHLQTASLWVRGEKQASEDAPLFKVAGAVLVFGVVPMMFYIEDRKKERFKAATAGVKTLYAYSGDDDSMFVELKRPEFEGGDDISRYVSWFRVRFVRFEKSTSPSGFETVWRAKRLGFVSWEGDERTFKEGVLTTPAESTKHFATAGKRVELTVADVGELEPEIIAACVYVWPTEPWSD